jgi:hypothetical protein
VAECRWFSEASKYGGILRDGIGVGLGWCLGHRRAAAKTKAEREEISGVKIGGEKMENMKGEVKWLAMGKVITSKPFIMTSLFSTMHFA